MKKLLVALCLCATALSAQNNRSFVSTTGNDANSCTPGNECRSFDRALQVTNPGGEILAISSGGYGPFTIHGPVTVIGAPGVSASITASTQRGIYVAAASGDRVAIRNVNITQTGSYDGLEASGFGHLILENIHVTGGVEGIHIDCISGPAVILDSVSVGASDSTFDIQSHAILVRCVAEGAGAAGLLVVDMTLSTGIVSAVDFVATGCTFGVYVYVISSGLTYVSLDHAVISRCVDGVEADNGGTARVAYSMITDNINYGLYKVGTGTVYSMQNNMISGNGLGAYNVAPTALPGI